MVKLTFCLRRRPDLTWDQFSDYWRDVHAPLVAARAQLLGIRRYVQLRTAQLPEVHAGFQRRNDGSPEPFDGVAELLADERNFIDLANSPIWIGEETVIVG